MIENFERIQPDYIPEAFGKLQHAIQHDKEDVAIIEALIDPDDLVEMMSDLRGTRRIIFSLMSDLGLLTPQPNYIDLTQ